jgi:hypothetical protein
MRQHLKDVGKWVASGPLLGIVGIVLTLAVASHDQMPLLAMCVIGTVSRVSWNFGDDPCGLYAAAPTVSARAVSGWACRYNAATS